MSPEEATDRLAITDKLHRYCRSVDRLDLAEGHAVFHPDSQADFGDTYRGSGRGWIDFICQEHRKFLHHSHQVSNIMISVDGDRAGSESYVAATLQRQDGDKVIQHMFWARYVDEWSRRDGEWAIDRRQCVVDFGEIREVAPLPGDPRARRDAEDPSCAVLKGPHA